MSDITAVRRANLEKARKVRAEKRAETSVLAPNEVRCTLCLPPDLTDEEKTRFVYGVQELIDGGVISLPDAKWER